MNITLMTDFSIAAYNNSNCNDSSVSNKSNDVMKSCKDLDTEDHNAIFEVIIVGVIGTLGIIGNVLSLVILSHREMRSSLNYGLRSLAVFDTVFLLGSVSTCCLHEVRNCRDQQGLLYSLSKAYQYTILVLTPITGISWAGSMWTTVGVTIERYIAVCHSLKAKSICTYTRIRIFNAIIAVFAICLSVPLFWKYESEECTDDRFGNKTFDILVEAPLPDEMHLKMFYVSMHFFFCYIIPFVSLTILNRYIWCTLKKANKERRTLCHRQQKEFSLAKMFFWITVVFLICNTTALVNNILQLFGEHLSFLNTSVGVLRTINSSINIIIYCMFSRNFRKLFLLTFFKYFKSTREQYSLPYTSSTR